MKECPCKSCNNRTPDCHGFCEKYKEWDRENQKLREKRSKQANQDRLIDEEIIRMRIRRQKKKGI